MPRRMAAVDLASRLKRELARALERLHEPARRRAVERVDEPLGRVEEVERVGRGRRVEEDEVVARVALHGEELLHRHVLLRAGERRGDVLVEDVVRGCESRFSGVGASDSMRLSKVLLVSSIITVIEPGHVDARALRRAPGRPAAPRSSSARGRGSARGGGPGRW